MKIKSKIIGSTLIGLVLLFFMLIVGWQNDKVWADESINCSYVYVESPTVAVSDSQNILVELSSETYTIEAATLNLVDEYGCTINVPASAVDGDAYLFTVSYGELNSDLYYVDSVDVAIEGEVKTVSFGTLGIDASFYVLHQSDVIEDTVSYICNNPGMNSEAVSDNIIVVLDPGHGGYDSGAPGNGLLEKDVNLQIALACKAELERYYNVTVYLTRTDDTYIALEDRVAYAESVGANLFVSIHNNSSTNVNANGAEVYYPNTSYNNALNEIGGDVAAEIQAKLVALGLKNRGIHTRDSANGTVYDDGSIADYNNVIRNSKKAGFTGIIVEHAFISNASDASTYLSSSAALQGLGKADAEGIAKYFGLKTDAPAFSIDGVTCIENSTGIAINTQVSGDIQNAQYRYLYYDLDNKVWGVISEDTNKSLIYWRPKAGRYWVQVYATSQHGVNSAFTSSAIATRSYSGTGITANGICYIINDTGVDIGFSFFSEDPNAQVRWMSYDLNTQTWKLISDWNSANWTTWKPCQGNYWLHAEAKASDGTTAEYTICFASQKDYDHYSLDIGGICYEIRDDSVAVGVAYTSSAPSVKIKWQAYNLDNGTWTDITGWTGTNWASWKPEKGNYWLHVTVETSDGNSKSYTICFASEKDYSHNYIELNGVCVLMDGAAIDLGAAYSTNDDSPKLRWMIYDCAQNSWTLLSDWSSGNWTSWYPSTGNYWIYVEAQTSDGVVESYCMGYEVTARYAIMGQSNTTIEQMVRYYLAHSSYPSYYAQSDAPTIEEFCRMYYEECHAEGVKAEVAFCQAMLETGFLHYGGDVEISQYNFAGIGATGNGAPGISYSSVREGIRAQVQHLKAYASYEPLNNTCVDERFTLVARGTALYVEWLGIKENPYGKGWAGSKNYGNIIVNQYIARLLVS